MIARLEVTRGTLTEYPLAEKVRDGWQNGVTFYPDAEVTKVTPLQVQKAHTPTNDERIVRALDYIENGTDDPDQQLAWERCAEMPGRIAALEAELAEVRAGVVAEEPEWEYGVRRRHGVDEYESEQWARWNVGRRGQDGEHQWVVRRRPGTAPGEWERVLVKQEGAEE